MDHNILFVCKITPKVFPRQNWAMSPLKTSITKKSLPSCAIPLSFSTPKALHSELEELSWILLCSCSQLAKTNSSAQWQRCERACSMSLLLYIRSLRILVWDWRLLAAARCLSPKKWDARKSVNAHNLTIALVTFMIHDIYKTMMTMQWQRTSLCVHDDAKNVPSVFS